MFLDDISTMLIAAHTTVRARCEGSKPKWSAVFDKSGDVLKNRPNMGEPATVLINNTLFFITWKDVYAFQGMCGAGYRAALAESLPASTIQL